VDLVTDLVARHGQQADEGIPGGDSSFLISDGREAFAVETCGRFWAEQVVASVRAVSDLCHLRQDWDRLSRGLSDCAIGQGWWPPDGTKLDFAGAMAPEGPNHAAALRRWGRATVLLEEHSGQIDVPFLRRLLSEHASEESQPPVSPSLSVCQHARGPDDVGTSAAFVVAAGLPGTLPLAWCAFGPPCLTVWFPVLLPGELPVAFEAASGESGCFAWRRAMSLVAAVRRDPARRAGAVEAMAAMQDHFDQAAREFLAEAAVLQQQNERAGMHRLSGLLMEHCLERWEAAVDELLPAEWRAQAPHGRTFEFVGSWE
jgi:hypothetical protein